MESTHNTTTDRAIVLCDRMRSTIVEDSHDAIEAIDRISDMIGIAARMAIGDDTWASDRQALAMIDQMYDADVSTPLGLLALAYSIGLAAGAQPTDKDIDAAWSLGLLGEE